MDIEIITSMQELENHPIKYHAADEVRRKLLELYYIAGNHYDYCHADYPVSGEPGDSAHLEEAYQNINQNFCKLALAVRDRVNEKACAKLEAFLPLENRLQRASFQGLSKLRDQPKGMLSPSDRKTVEKLFKKYMNTKENGKEASSPAR